MAAIHAEAPEVYRLIADYLSHGAQHPAAVAIRVPLPRIAFGVSRSRLESWELLARIRGQGRGGAHA